MQDKIVIHGARVHNLKNIHLELPRNKFIVVTGVSGSGKSSLAFDTIYAEGQRRYVESLSAYARQFLELMDKPDVDYILGLSPAISIEQRTPSHNPRSTVATQTETYDYLRLLFARVGTPHCADCGREVKALSASQIVAQILTNNDAQDITLYSPVVRGRTGTYDALLAKLRSQGWVRARIDGKPVSLDRKPPALSRYVKHTIEIEVDRLKVTAASKTRLAESVEAALRESRGLIGVETKKKSQVYSQHLSCIHCGTTIAEMEPRLFSFNSPYGACPKCEGLAVTLEVDTALVVPDPKKSLAEGAIYPWTEPITTRTHRWKNSWRSYYDEILGQVCESQGIPMDVPWKKLPRKAKEIILYGGGSYKLHWMNKNKDFEGVIGGIRRRYDETDSDFVKEEIRSRYMRSIPCKLCEGKRLKKEALAVTVGGRNIAQLTALSVLNAQDFFRNLNLNPKEQEIARQVFKEIRSRLGFLSNVGLGYLTLDRQSQTLSGGEAQRIHLATQIGSGLVGVLYVLDEPTVGLHPKDNALLLRVLGQLRDQGNTLLVVEHDEETMRSADWIVDIGPAGGEHGGKVVYSGPFEGLLKNKESLTAMYLNGAKKIEMKQRGPVSPDNRLAAAISPRSSIDIMGARQFNLKNIDVTIPLGKFVCVTGVSGSGKSTLVHEILYKAASVKFYGSRESPGLHTKIEGLEHTDKVLLVDQDPIGRTPRSNPATYTEVWSPIREIFALLPESRRRGYKPGRFSFNVPGGRCENCGGDGYLKIEMQFLADVYVSCEVCRGRRFNEETLEVRFDDKTIADVLDSSVSRAIDIFRDFPKINRMLKVLEDVGLGYIKLGQPATTLSGGEAQRVKLAAELAKFATGRTLYILDEPTTGLHFDDVAKLLIVLHRLVAQGNTVVVIEHNVDVIKTADWIVDLGPQGGDAGGYLVVQGPPQAVASHDASHTGRYLRSGRKEDRRKVGSVN
ncbi:MAG: excinuclease ABC subunit UvrA [Elusimicrobia bacterium]|nr:excinuclease ABC subunit UvrA [Elusimicrobiota bacterium]